MRFWDSSAIVPLIIRQPSSDQADAWIRDDGEMVIWALTPVEIVSAIRRLVRERVMDDPSGMATEEIAIDLLKGAHEITAIDRVGAIARRVLRIHPLRAADALQLASALVWCEHDPRGAVLHTLDARLAAAAVHEGFLVLPRPGA